MSDERVIVAIADGIAEVALNRPDKLNAWDGAMFEAVSEAGNRLKTEPGLRAVILHGNGRAFSAGIDIASFGAGAAELLRMRADLAVPVHGSAANRFQHPCTVWAEVPVPVIAAIHGVCFGAGLQLALGCDLRIAAPDARLSIMEARWGLVPDMGLTQFLPRLMAADRALEAMLSARVIAAPEACDLGLVTRLETSPLEAARALARTIAGRNPEAVRAMKALVAAAWPGGPGQLALEARLQAEIIGSPNQIEAVMAETQRRPARFV